MRVDQNASAGSAIIVAAPVLMRAADGTLVEVFEWKDGATERAHGMPEVQALWADYAEVCTYRPIAELDATTDPYVQQFIHGRADGPMGTSRYSLLAL